MAKTIEELQAAVDAIRAVCNAHGVVLIGSCESEGIYGEIAVEDAAASKVFTDIVERELLERYCTPQWWNVVDGPRGHSVSFTVNVIGDPAP